mgnify:FL=1
MEEQKIILKPVNDRVSMFEDMLQSGQHKTNISVLLARALADADYECLDINELQAIKNLISEIISFRDLFFDHKNKFIERLNKEKQKLKSQMMVELNEEKNKMINDIRSKIASKIIESKSKKVDFESEEDTESTEEAKPKQKRKTITKKK